MVAFVLLVVGGLNWLFIGAFDINLVNSLFVDMPGVERWVYILIGLSAAYIAATHMKDCKHCSSKKK